MDDWLGPWISFLWFLFLCISAFSIRMIYKTFIKFRDTLTYRDSDDEYQFKGQGQIFKSLFEISINQSFYSPEVHRKWCTLFDLLKEDCIYEHETALGCWKLEGKTTIKKTKIIYFVYTIPLLIAWDCFQNVFPSDRIAMIHCLWLMGLAHGLNQGFSGPGLHWKLKKSDLFLDIGYISSFTFNETRMISPFIEVRPGIFILMGMFDILGTFRIFLCAAMLWKFSEKLYTQAGINGR